MSLNLTAAYLEARLAPMLLLFSKALVTSSTFLAGPGGLAASGFPLPHGGTLRGMRVYDGATVHSSTTSTPVSAGDRIAVFATYDGGSEFTVTVTINSNFTSTSVSGVRANDNIFATLDLLFEEDA